MTSFPKINFESRTPLARKPATDVPGRFHAKFLEAGRMTAGWVTPALHSTREFLVLVLTLIALFLGDAELVFSQEVTGAITGSDLTVIRLRVSEVAVSDSIKLPDSLNREIAS